MALAALSEYGVNKLLQVIGMVVGVHFVEAYLLYPQVRGGERARSARRLSGRGRRGAPRRAAAPSRRAASAQIYAAKLKLHPLLVLVALYVTEHVVGVKGLFLTLPVTLFILGLIGVGDKARAPPSGMPALAS